MASSLFQAANELADLASRTIPELKAMCKELGLPVSGTKPVLVDRLQAHFGPPPPPMPATQASSAVAPTVTSTPAPPASSVGRKRILPSNLAPQPEMPEAQPAPSKKKRTSKSNAASASSSSSSAVASTAAEKEEKRAAKVRKPTAKLRERIQRAFEHRLFLITIPVIDHANLTYEFKVLGQTGNVYTVQISKTPRCTCPDGQKGNNCKHMFYIYLRVLKVNAANDILWQRALLTSELRQFIEPRMRQIEANQVDKSVFADERVRKFVELGVVSDAGPPKVQQRRGDDCPICYDVFHPGEATVYCETSCGQTFHKNCIDMVKSHSHGKMTCPMCRADWGPPAASSRGGSKVSQSGSYVNVAGLSQAHQKEVSLRELYPETFMYMNRRRRGRHDDDDDDDEE